MSKFKAQYAQEYLKHTAFTFSQFSYIIIVCIFSHSPRHQPTTPLYLFLDTHTKWLCYYFYYMFRHFDRKHQRLCGGQQYSRVDSANDVVSFCCRLCCQLRPSVAPTSDHCRVTKSIFIIFLTLCIQNKNISLIGAIVLEFVRRYVMLRYVHYHNTLVKG